MSYPLTAAQANLAELIAEARRSHRPVTISEHGRPVAVLINVEDLADLRLPLPCVSPAKGRWRHGTALRNWMPRSTGSTRNASREPDLLFGRRRYVISPISVARTRICSPGRAVPSARWPISLSAGCGRVGLHRRVPAARGRHPDRLRRRRSGGDGVHHQHWDHRLDRPTPPGDLISRANCAHHQDNAASFHRGDRRIHGHDRERGVGGRGGDHPGRLPADAARVHRARAADAGVPAGAIARGFPP